jgi:hypothetical protein
MRRPEYVDDVLAELKTPVQPRSREDSWRKLNGLTANLQGQNG